MMTGNPSSTVCPVNAEKLLDLGRSLGKKPGLGVAPPFIDDRLPRGNEPVPASPDKGLLIPSSLQPNDAESADSGPGTGDPGRPSPRPIDMDGPSTGDSGGETDENGCGRGECCWLFAWLPTKNEIGTGPGLDARSTFVRPWKAVAGSSDGLMGC